MVPFEESNVEALKLFIRLEVALRELLARGLARLHGNSWRKRLPGSLLKKIRQCENEESSRAQFGFLRLGPLYYLSFGELLELLDQKDGAEIVASARLGGLRHQFSNLLPVRNALAHSRAVTPTGLRAIQSCYEQLTTALGVDTLSELLSNPETGIPPEHAIIDLRAFVEGVRASAAELDSIIPITPSLDLIQHQYWWGNQELSGFDCSVIEPIITFARSYNRLSSGVGSAGERQDLVRSTAIGEAIQVALLALGGAAGD
jgi:hypothetical protein